jgi:hypothetical protein
VITLAGIIGGIAPSPGGMWSWKPA